MLKENKLSNDISIISKSVLQKNEGDIKTARDKEKLREFITTRDIKKKSLRFM